MSDRTSVGYLFLKEKHSLRTLPHYVESYIAEGSRRTNRESYKTEEIYPKSYWPGESDWNHLEFALKYEGLHLQFLRELLPRYPANDVKSFVQTKPTGAYARRLWFLYEAFTGTQLDVPDLTQGNYADLLDPMEYYVGTVERSPRHRINNNLPGTLEFSPMVRRTRRLTEFENKKLEERCRRIMAEVPPEIYQRAIDYLFVKETKSSYAIERETPDQKRAERFAKVLREARSHDYLEKQNLVELQKAIVDSRFAHSGWRDSINEQNYVGEILSLTEERVHFIPPKPADIGHLMSSFEVASRRILQSSAHPVVAAAAIAYPFVFLHPFLDGNGRIHRFLIHYVLSVHNFAPEGVIFPISATMLHHLDRYDESLEAFSKPVMPLIDWEFEGNPKKLRVLNETADLYRYIDCTLMAEALFYFVEGTIEEELPKEISFLKNYDTARDRMRSIVDMPERHASLFLRLCLQNGGRVSNNKRRLPEFAQLLDQEISDLEEAIASAFGLKVDGGSSRSP